MELVSARGKRAEMKVEKIVRMLSGTIRQDVFDAVELAANELPDEVASFLLRSLTLSADDSIKDYAIEWIGVVAHPEDEELLIGFSRDKSELIRCTAASALSNYETQSAKERILEMLTDRSPIVRKWAAVALADWGTSAEVKSRLLERAREEKHPMALVGVYGALSILGDDPTWETLLLELPNHRWCTTRLKRTHIEAAVKGTLSGIEAGKGTRSGKRDD